MFTKYLVCRVHVALLIISKMSVYVPVNAQERAWSAGLFRRVDRHGQFRADSKQL